MPIEFRTREELARVLNCDVKTLRRRLHKAGFQLDKGRICVKDWNEILGYFLGDKNVDTQKRPNIPNHSQNEMENRW